jgi:DNA modification methylase
MTVKLYVKSSENMSELKDDSIQLAITNIDQPTIDFSGAEAVTSTIARRNIKAHCPTQTLFRILYFNLRSSMLDYTKNVLELQRVLKPDGILVWNVGNAIICGTTDTFEGDMSILWPYLLAEDIVMLTDLRLRRDLIAIHKRDENDARYEHWFVFSKGEDWKESSTAFPPVIYGESSRMRKRIQIGDENEEVKVLPFAESNIELFINAYSEEGDTVLDPFAGTGKVGIVANRMNRNAVLYENNKFMAEWLKQILEENKITPE